LQESSRLHHSGVSGGLLIPAIVASEGVNLTTNLVSWAVLSFFGKKTLKKAKKGGFGGGGKKGSKKAKKGHFGGGVKKRLPK